MKITLWAPLLLFGLLTLSVSAQNCWQLARNNGCEFYPRCLEARSPCGQSGYAMGYGYKYCRRFAQMSHLFNAAVSVPLLCDDVQHILQHMYVHVLCIYTVSNHYTKIHIPSIQGRVWINRVRRCLKIKLYAVHNIRNCYIIKSYAFSSHTNCYVSSGFCRIVWSNWRGLNAVLHFKDSFSLESLQQVGHCMSGVHFY